MGFISPFLKFFKIFLVLKVHWDDPEAWDGKGGGRWGSGWGIYVYPWRIHVNV